MGGSAGLDDARDEAAQVGRLQVLARTAADEEEALRRDARVGVQGQRLGLFTLELLVGDEAAEQPVEPRVDRLEDGALPDLVLEHQQTQDATRQLRDVIRVEGELHRSRVLARAEALVKLISPSAFPTENASCRARAGRCQQIL